MNSSSLDAYPKFCILECFCFCTGLSREYFIEAVGHDGTEIINPNGLGNRKYKSFTLDELIPTLKCPNVLSTNRNMILALMFTDATAIYFYTKNQHCVAFKDGKYFDLSGYVKTSSDFMDTKPDAVLVFNG